jgi:hypothetical protein
VKPLERITLVVPPIVPPFDVPPGQTPARAFYQYDRFATELQQETPARVEIFEGMPNRAPRDGMLLIAPRQGLDEAPEQLDQLAPQDPRPLLINVINFDDAEFIRTWAPAGMVISRRYLRWLVRQEDKIREHICGATSLAPALAPLLVARDDWRNPGYSIYRSRDALPLPGVIARYIEAYWQSFG